MAKQKANTRKNKKPGKVIANDLTLAANLWGEYRKPFRGKIKSFTFKEIDGIKVVEEPSNHTATIIGWEGPALRCELTQAMTYCQRSFAKTRRAASVTTIRARFPMIDKYLEDDKVQNIACSDAGKKSARKEAVSILAERLQIDPHTVERYFRQPTKIRTDLVQSF